MTFFFGDEEMNNNKVLCTNYNIQWQGIYKVWHLIVPSALLQRSDDELVMM